MKVSKSGLFLFELIVVIFLFTVSAAVCISIFANSYNYSILSKNLTSSTLKAETVAEVFKDTDGDAEAMVAALDLNEDTHDIILTEETSSESDDAAESYILNIYFDEQWANTDEQNHAYTFIVKVEVCEWKKVGYTLIADMKVTRKNNNEKIFSMSAKKYVNPDNEEAVDE